MFDLRGKPGYDRFPYRIGDDVVLKTGGPVMTVVDFNEKGEVTASWRSAGKKPSELTIHHAQVLPWDDAVI